MKINLQLSIRGRGEAIVPRLKNARGNTNKGRDHHELECLEIVVLRVLIADNFAYLAAAKRWSTHSRSRSRSVVAPTTFLVGVDMSALIMEEGAERTSSDA